MSLAAVGDWLLAIVYVTPVVTLVIRLGCQSGHEQKTNEQFLDLHSAPSENGVPAAQPHDSSVQLNKVA